jgi:hypothetical protein
LRRISYDFEAAFFHGIEPFEPLAVFRAQGDHAVCQIVKILSGWGQFHPVAAAHLKKRPDTFFEVRNMLRDRGLGDAQPCCGGRKASFADNIGKGFELMVVGAHDLSFLPPT